MGTNNPPPPEGDGGRNIIITGASRGLGKAIAEIFAENGYDLYLTSMNEARLKKAVEELSKKNPAITVKAKPFDLSKKEQTKSFGEWCLKNCSPDILVNNAGSFTGANVYNEQEGALEEMIETNLYSAYHLTRSIVPAMIQKKSGHIFNMSSIAGLKAYRGGFFIFIEMKRYGYIPFCWIIQCFFFLPVFGQVRFRTVVPQHAMVPGESFQVQYILENVEKIADFSPPPFQGFRIVSGPNIYSGDKSTSYKNWVFTLAAIKEGIFKIHGATCLINGRLQKSNDVTVKILSPGESDQSSYFLKPGEDPFKKIRENLFLKLIIDKQTCFIGEPLVATFKLYSRLQSRSNVIKNPGFYGFSVYDMVEVGDKMESEEKLDGHWFDVHTIREVQLYPLQTGTFTIDAMELENQVEFYRSAVSKKTEQEVTENMYGNDKEKNKHDANAEVYEMNIKSNRAVVTVKPLPAKNMLDTFAGAVGNFSITAAVEKDSLLKNEEGLLTVDINDFYQCKKQKK